MEATNNDVLPICGEWAMHPDWIARAVSAQLPESVSRVNAVRSLLVRSSSSPQDSIAVITLSGTLSRGGDYYNGTSTAQVALEISRAAADPSISGIVLDINSPGGTFSGTKELGDAVTNAKQSKPVYASITDLGASAAYWIASQATQVYATVDSLVGSIGTYGAVVDMSRYLDNIGVKVQVIRADQTGEHKAAGYPGTQLTESQLAEMRKTMTSRNQFFLDAVTQGRGLSPVALAQIADGRVFPASEAKQLGLVDVVGTLSQALSDLQAAASNKGQPKMETNADVAKPESAPAFSETITQRVAAYRTATAGIATADEILTWMAQGVSVSDAQVSTLEKMVAQSAISAQRIATLETQLAAASNVPVAAAPVARIAVGVAPVQETPHADVASPDSAEKEWKDGMKSLMLNEGLTRAAAYSRMKQTRPDLIAAMQGK